MYNAEKGYGLQLTKFDEQYEDTIIYRDSKKAIIELADKIIISFGHKSLMEMLNEMQSEALYNNKMVGMPEEELKKTCWYSKYDIPSYFINLLLKQYNVQVLGW